jgi:hypothetical protein
MSKPEKVFKMGAVRASIFRNIIVQDGRNVALPKVVIEVRYRDKTGKWQGTNSLSINDLPKAISALQQAYEYLLNGEATADHEADQMDDQPAAPEPAKGSPIPASRWPSRY